MWFYSHPKEFLSPKWMLMNFKPMVYHWQEASWLHPDIPPAWGLWLSQLSSHTPAHRAPSPPPQPLLLLTQDAATQMPNGDLPQGFSVNMWCGGHAPPLPTGIYIVIRTGDGFFTWGQECVSKHMFLKEGTLGDFQPLPSFQGANSPPFLQTLGLWSPVVAASPKGCCASCLRCSLH